MIRKIATILTLSWLALMLVSPLSSAGTITFQGVQKWEISDLWDANTGQVAQTAYINYFNFYVTAPGYFDVQFTYPKRPYLSEEGGFKFRTNAGWGPSWGPVEGPYPNMDGYAHLPGIYTIGVLWMPYSHSYISLDSYELDGFVWCCSIPTIPGNLSTFQAMPFTMRITGEVARVSVPEPSPILLTGLSLLLLPFMRRRRKS